MTTDEETRRTVRVPEDEWRRAKSAAALNGRTLSDVVRQYLREYVKVTAESGPDGSPFEDPVGADIAARHFGAGYGYGRDVEAGREE